MSNYVHVLGQKLKMSVGLSSKGQGCQKGAPASCVLLKSTLARKQYGKVCLELNSKHSCLPVNRYGIGFLEMSGVYHLTSALEGETLGSEKSLRKDTYLTPDFGPNPTPLPGDNGKKIPALPLAETSSQKTELLWTWVEIRHSNLFQRLETDTPQYLPLGLNPTRG